MCLVNCKKQKPEEKSRKKAPPCNAVVNGVNEVLQLHYNVCFIKEHPLCFFYLILTIFLLFSE